MSRPPAKANTKIQIQKGQNEKIQFCCGAMQGWRPQMQDEHMCEIGNLPDGNSLFAVFDGHGGKEVSAYVKKKFIEILISLQEYKHKKYSQALQTTFEKVDALMLTHEGQKQMNLSSTKKTQLSPALLCGCTGNVILITQDQIYTANCGDSRAAMLVMNNGQQNRYKELSHDHKPQNPKQKQRIQKAGGYIANNRVNGNLNLSRAFGDFYYKKNPTLSSRDQLITCFPDINQFQLPKNQSIIVQGCDGIWQFFDQSSAGLLQIVASDQEMGLTAEQSVKNLLNMLVSKNIIETKGKGCDNMTAIIIKLKGQ